MEGEPNLQGIVNTTAMVEVRPDLDLQIKSFYTEALKAKEYAEARIIATVEDLTPASEDLLLIRKLKKAMEEKRKEYIKPLQDHTKAINDTFKTLMEPIEIADKATSEKILAFNLKQKLIREEQERINALRMEAAKKEMELKGELTESVGLVEVMPEIAKRTVTELGTVGMRDSWTYEVINFALLPNEYKVADTAMLNTIAKKYHDLKPIPGVRFFNKPILAGNTR